MGTAQISSRTTLRRLVEELRVKELTRHPTTFDAQWRIKEDLLLWVDNCPQACLDPIMWVVEESDGDYGDLLYIPSFTETLLEELSRAGLPAPSVTLELFTYYNLAIDRHDSIKYFY